MGCSVSKHDNLPAVALCRDRCRFMQNALRHSYALADAHVAYMQSLHTLGPTLLQFFHHYHHSRLGANSSNADAAIPDSESSHRRRPSSLSCSTSDSHIHFDSDEEERILDCESFDSHNPDYFHQDSLSSGHQHNHYSTYNGEISRTDWPAHHTPPPPPPSSSAWDFLNFFEPLEKYEPAHYVPESEPKQVNVSRKNNKISVLAKNDKVRPTTRERKTMLSETKQSTADDRKGQPDVSEVMKEVQVLFQKASESGNDVLKMFDGGQLRYHHHYSISRVSTKMFYAVAPSKLMVSTPLSYQRFDDDDPINLKNLTASLRKLCMWERKLYEEVKAEEKMRILYARKYKQMKSSGNKGAETLEAARATLRALSTKIQIAIQVIDKMSISINKLRDEELWPQITELVHRLLGMWKAMLECHRGQATIISESKSLDGTASEAKLENDHLEVAIRLKLELRTWNVTFSDWIEAQRGYVKAMDGWLLKCLPHEPKETPHGRAPFSPGRIGAPAVFVIAHSWSQAMDMLSEKEVTEAVQSLCSSINQLLEEHQVELQQMAVTSRDVDRKLKILERKEHKMQKVMQAREKKMNAAPAGDSNKFYSTGSLHSGLRQSFMAIERFAAKSEQAYDELCLRIEESKLTSMTSAGP